MFVRTNVELPVDATSETTLIELGYKLNDKGQFVKFHTSSSTPSFFEFFVSDSESRNEENREKMHEAARNVVMQMLEKLGVRETFLWGEDGAEISDAKPTAPHVTILTTELAELKNKKDVVVVIGDHNADAGIWAYRHFLGEGGVDGGSAVGLVKKLESVGLEGYLAKDFKKYTTDYEARHAFEKDYPTKAVEEEDVPGMIILNPGQLLYSPKKNKSMTYASWRARERPTALSASYVIDPISNRVAGHGTADEHIDTVLTHVVSNIVGPDAKLYVVCVSDGAERFVKWMDHAFEAEHLNPITHMTSAVVLMESTHEHKGIKSSEFVEKLAYLGRSWIKSDQPKGQLMNTPGGVKKIHYQSSDEETDDGADSLADSVASLQVDPEASEILTKSIESVDAGVAGDQPVVVKKSTHNKPVKESYDYDAHTVSCPTFSAGIEDYDELIFPNVVEELLAHFRHMALRSAAEARADGIREENGEGEIQIGYQA
ncbi:hypothetical protein LTR37_018278 [Vermiconidia calcicola]|uniref:Uncharacterized protein n=1 Tax=Vermiconidia calcicola TaxID=1690605 RepID=A0ACC3MJ83_9PEZI|nr:hypothetical protein LTR37_018278 [Vermiconidia calcicola]